MRQPPQPQSSSTPTPSGTDGYGPATPYGVMPHGPYAPASPPHAALTPGHGPQSGQQVDYPYLFQAQTAPPTQPVAPHLSSIGQPASSIVTNGADIDPYSAGPTAFRAASTGRRATARRHPHDRLALTHPLEARPSHRPRHSPDRLRNSGRMGPLRPPQATQIHRPSGFHTELHPVLDVLRARNAGCLVVRPSLFVTEDYL